MNVLSSKMQILSFFHCQELLRVHENCSINALHDLAFLPEAFSIFNIPT